MKRKIYVIAAALFMLVFAGCSNDKKGTVVTGQNYYKPEGSEQEQETENATEETESIAESQRESNPEITTDMYLIITNDMAMEHMILEQLASGRQYMYYYTLSTDFKDKYGDRTTASEFFPGRIVNIGTKDEDGKLTEIQICDKVWEYDDITRYKIDEERRVFQIADTKYSYDEDLHVCSDGETLRLSSLTELDEVRVVGIEKKILSVAVVSGHGELQLENTELFEGSYIQIGDKIFAEITANMNMEIPEGNYTVTVANDGYGGSKEITITRGETLTLDLDELKGEGPKYGDILFAVDVQGAKLKLDGKVIDYGEPVEIRYGRHYIEASASGYEDYSRILFVNSEEATILIELSGEDTITTAEQNSSSETAGSDSNAETQENTQVGGQAGSQAGSLAGSQSAGNSSSTGTTSNDTTANSAGTEGTTETNENTATDYLSTLSELLSVLSD